MHTLFRDIFGDSEPTEATKRRIAKRVFAEQNNEHILAEARTLLSPAERCRQSVWNRIAKRLLPKTAVDLLIRVQQLLMPPTGVQLALRKKLTTQQRVQPLRRLIAGQWFARIALCAVVVRLIPFAFIAQPTFAATEIRIVQDYGDVIVTKGEQSTVLVGNLEAGEGQLVSTTDGEAHINIHSVGVVRLAPETTVRINTTERNNRTQSVVTLQNGRIWVQSFDTEGLSVGIFHGQVLSRHASFLVEENSSTLTSSITVFDRRIDYLSEYAPISIIAGNQIVISDDGTPRTHDLDEDIYQEEWILYNAQKDLEYRQEVLQEQQQKQVQSAGILPDSPLYRVKRIAEQMDELMTITQSGRAKKQLARAQTRLAEAAVMIDKGNIDDANDVLSEYQDILSGLAGPEAEQVAASVLDESLSNMVASVSVIPADSPQYHLKRAVLEASADLSTATLSNQTVEEMIFLDTISALTNAANAPEMDTELIERTWLQLDSYRIALDNKDPSLSDTSIQEAEALLGKFAETLVKRSGVESEGIDDKFLQEIVVYVPEPPVDPTTIIASAVQSILLDMQRFQLTRSQMNRLVQATRDLDSHPYKTAILRELYRQLPEGDAQLHRVVRQEILASGQSL